MAPTPIICAKPWNWAKRHNVSAGAHFSLPDLAGFVRREMKIERPELANIITYQVRALKGFLDLVRVKLSHMKPHGALYAMAAHDEHIAHAICDACEMYDVPIFGLAGTLHEEVYNARNVEFVEEFFADLDYDETGNVIITREHPSWDPGLVAQKVRRSVNEGVVATTRALADQAGSYPAVLK